MWNSKDLSAVKSINRMTWMFKNNFKRRNVIAFNFFSFSRKETNGQTGEQQTRRADKSVLELKTAWYFCYSKKKGGEGLKEQKQKLLRVKRCLRVPSTFSWYFVSWWKILCCSSRRQRWLVRFRHQPSETPAHSPSRACHRILNHSHTQCHPPILTQTPLHPAHLFHFPWITCTEISGSTMYSNLVWILCCSLAFLKW